MSSRVIAEQNTILRVVVGSTLHGLSLDGKDDRDEMGVCIEPAEYVIGLRRFEQWVYRTQPEGVPSGPGDLDCTIYSLRKWCRLALNGNPTTLLLLFAPPSSIVVQTAEGQQLQSLTPFFVSRRAGRAFLGYLVAQKQRLLGERGQRRINRRAIIEAHGYDTKYAMHAFRLGWQGVELLETGRVTLPMPQPWRDMAMEIRRGKVRLVVVESAITEAERKLEALLDSSPLPEQPNSDAVNDFLRTTYLDWWKGAPPCPLLST